MEANTPDAAELDSESPLRILAVCGSLNTKSTTKMALSLVLKGAEELGADTKLISLRDYKLVFYGEVDERRVVSPEVV